MENVVKINISTNSVNFHEIPESEVKLLFLDDYDLVLQSDDEEGNPLPYKRKCKISFLCWDSGKTSEFEGECVVSQADEECGLCTDYHSLVEIDAQCVCRKQHKIYLEFTSLGKELETIKNY